MKSTMVLLLENHFNEIRSKVIKYALDKRHSSPEDIFSESLISALKKSSTFEGDLSNLISFILTIAHYKIIDYYRTPYARKTILVDEFYDDAFHSNNDKYFIHLEMNNILQKLTTIERDVIVCKYIHDLNDFDTSKFLNTNYSNIRIIRHRALKKIHKEMYKQKTEILVT